MAEENALVSVVRDPGRVMSRENVEVVRKSFEAFSVGGVEAVLPFYPPDVVWYMTDRWIEDSVYRGHAGIRTLTAIFTDNFDDMPGRFTRSVTRRAALSSLRK